MSIDISRLGPAAQKQILKKLREADAKKAEKNTGPVMASAPAKENKLHAEKTDGYDSKKEAKRADELRLMQAAGQIKNLAEQVAFELIPPQRDKNGKLLERGLNYIADFAYTDCKTGEYVVEDVKGYKNPASAPYRVFVIKRKLMLFRHGIRVREV